MDLQGKKLEVYNACLQILENKLAELMTVMEGFQAAANEETKSSAGDKYETGRAMMHLEKEKLAAQMDAVVKQQKVFHQINPQKISEQIELGSIIKTNKGWFFISASLGMVKAPESYMCISPVAPLGQVFLGKKTGDAITFNKMTYQIEAVG